MPESTSLSRPSLQCNPERLCRLAGEELLTTVRRRVGLLLLAADGQRPTGGRKIHPALSTMTTAIKPVHLKTANSCPLSQPAMEQRLLFEPVCVKSLHCLLTTAGFFFSWSEGSTFRFFKICLAGQTGYLEKNTQCPIATLKSILPPSIQVGQHDRFDFKRPLH